MFCVGSLVLAAKSEGECPCGDSLCYCDGDEDELSFCELKADGDSKCKGCDDFADDANECTDKYSDLGKYSELTLSRCLQCVPPPPAPPALPPAPPPLAPPCPVSYTHLTLPTILLV